MLKPVLGLCCEVVEFVQDLFSLLDETVMDTGAEIHCLEANFGERAFKFLCSRIEVPGRGKVVLHTLVYPAE